MKLVVISHTEHYRQEDGALVGLGSTITEINHLLDLFDEIYHLAMLHSGQSPASALPYASDRIHFVPLPTVGGHRFHDKLTILWKAPKTLRILKRYLKRTDVFQFRAPTGIGVFVIPYLMFLVKKRGWYKYAGNWEQENAPLAYQFQRWLLKRQSRKVTINGVWDNQPTQCLSFENACLTLDELEAGHKTSKDKNFDKTQLEFCFVGRVEEAKGIGMLIDALNMLDSKIKSNIKAIHIVGGGSSGFSFYKRLAQNTGLPFIFYGALARNQVHDIYKLSHALILPSASEGFPKVLSEAMNYGCIPIVSNVSMIGNYIKHGVNGFLIEPLTVEVLHETILEFVNISKFEFKALVEQARNSMELFTYTYYNRRLKDDVLN